MNRRAVSLHEYERKAKASAKRTLRPVAARARKAGVRYDEDYALCNRPHEAIVDAAHKHGCDLIFMASRGRRGLSALLRGSQAREVMTRSGVPMLIYRQEKTKR